MQSFGLSIKMYNNMFRSLALGALWATTVLAAPSVERQAYVRCGADSPPAALVAAAQSMAIRPVPQAARTLNVVTYLHVVTTAAKQGSITQTQLNNQVHTSYRHSTSRRH